MYLMYLAAFRPDLNIFSARTLIVCVLTQEDTWATQVGISTIHLMTVGMIQNVSESPGALLDLVVNFP